MSDHNENCAIFHNSIDECDCEQGQIRDLRSKLAIAVEALEGIKELYMGDDCPEQRDYYRMADRALAKIRS